MAVVNVSGTVNKLTSVDSPTPTGLAQSATNGGKIHFIRDTVEVAAADSDNSVYRLARVPSNAVIVDLRINNDAITGGTDYNVGVYDTPEINGGAAIDDNAFMDAVDLSSASSGEGTYALTAIAIENRHKQVWQHAGLSADPKKLVDIALTGITVGTGAGTIALSVTYSLV